MLMDPHHSQQHAGLQQAVCGLQQEVTMPEAQEVWDEPASMWHWDSNSRPLKHVSPYINNKPVLPSIFLLWYKQLFLNEPVLASFSLFSSFQYSWQ